MNMHLIAQRILERFPDYFNMDDDELEVTNAEINVMLAEEFGIDALSDTAFNDALIIELENAAFPPPLVLG